jgi:radical SAM protein with 4Fe4S-binding SPASM domain
VNESKAIALPKPLGLLAELTHRCPLGCPYCSNPLTLERREDELDAGTWARVFAEAAALGVLQVHLSGGEPGARRDLVEISASAREAGLYTNLITSGVGITTRTLRDLWEAGLDHVQVSIQDSDAVSSDHIVRRAVAEVDELRRQYHGRIVIDAVVPDYHARTPKPCVGGWGRRSLNVTPSGRVLPCHAAESIPGLEFWNVRDHSLGEIWAASPAFNAFRGTDFLPEPCASCDRREIDFGGCRCQAFLLTGDARATDPVCHLSPNHARVTELAAAQEDVAYIYRRM